MTKDLNFDSGIRNVEKGSWPEPGCAGRSELVFARNREVTTSPCTFSCTFSYLPTYHPWDESG